MRQSPKSASMPTVPPLSHEANERLLRSARRDCARARNRSNDTGADLLENAEETETETGAQRHRVAS
ncbi:MAG TPA: hypothetical protein VHA78_00345 [Candidatus Peribacteraceae bacterium]|nr:hypothetical protein [Candidatus Peribacteraceae bacterium]